MSVAFLAPTVATAGLLEKQSETSVFVVSMVNSISSSSAVISVSTKSNGQSPLIVHRDTKLGQLPPRANQPYVLVSDDEQRIVGIVPSHEIDGRLLASNQIERRRWSAMPIGAMSKVALSGAGRVSSPGDGSKIACTAIREHGELFGLAVDGDMFLSWKRLESVLTSALSDPLTGLMNRIAYEQRLRQEWNRAQRTSASIGVVLVDLDDFKIINDTYGHSVGDDLLTEVGRKLEGAMRSYDAVARFGGDEFVALCLGCAPEDIRIPMARLANAMSEIELEVDGGVIKVGASIGAAVRHGDYECNFPDELFVSADKCLYEAKKTRNSAWKTELGTGDDLQMTQVATETDSHLLPVS